MKLLWLNAGVLLPLDKGGKLRTWHLMRHLARQHDITYVCFSEPSQSPGDLAGMAEICRHLVTVPRSDPVKGTWRFRADAARYVFDSAPYAVAKYRSVAYQARVHDLLRDGRFDAVVCDFLVPAINMPASLPCPSVLFTHNVEAEIWRRHAETAVNRVTRALLAQQWRRMLRFEGDALARFDLVLAVSDADRRTFERLYSRSLRCPVHVVPTGVETAYFAPAPDLEDGEGPAKAGHHDCHLVFTGSMDWLPNEDGMMYFAREILPRIREQVPETSLSIVGRSPTATVRQLAEVPGIQVTGRVDDVRPHVAAGTVYVVPLRIGGGTRLKIFEAMAMGKAVVSTAIGAEGLPVTHGQDILIENEPARFAAAVIRLLRDTTERTRLQAAARRLVKDRFDWSAVAQEFEDALTRLCQPRPAAAKKGAPAHDSTESDARLVESF